MGKQKKRETYAQVRERLKNQYGARKVYRWLGYADDPTEKIVVDLVKHYSSTLNIEVSYFYTIAIGEGLGDEYLNLPYARDKKGLIRSDQSLSGLRVFGVDDFSDDFPRVKKYLPSDYNEGDEFYKIEGHRPQDFGRKKVNTAIFKDLESGLEGFGAILRHRRDIFLREAKQFGYPTPTEDQIAYWNYCYYQGEGRARRYLEYNGGLDYTKPAPINMREIQQLALERLATWRYVQYYNLFD